MTRSAIVVHSIYGLRPAVRRFGEDLGALGLDVALVDLFDGRTTTDTQEGFGFAESIDEGAAVDDVVALATQRAERDGEQPLLAGFSFGAGVVGQAAIAGAPAAGLAMISEAWPSEFLLRLPAGLPVLEQVVEGDGFADVPDATEGASAATEAGRSVLLRVYPGDGHLFTDADHPDSEPDAARDAADDLREWLRSQGIAQQGTAQS